MTNKITARQKDENLRTQAIELLGLDTAINSETSDFPLFQTANGKFIIPLVDLEGESRWVEINIVAKNTKFDGDFEVSEWTAKQEKAKVEEEKRETKRRLAEEKRALDEKFRAKKEALKAKIEDVSESETVVETETETEIEPVIEVELEE